ncbi:hypothetical protein IIF7_08955 [Zunongwangia atlantica 22II14-10F7]|uniref:Uncharacterized protein n=1 Tax=Zunongwangia atlantica 22II14-10F7 TaxID=1185767 RepID=A0A1Y1T3Z5_9FLAO|nr:hypothetical protein IIF7_08955 [Zunongwangia atlantica 22II14-10F7]
MKIDELFYSKENTQILKKNKLKISNFSLKYFRNISWVRNEVLNEIYLVAPRKAVIL